MRSTAASRTLLSAAVANEDIGAFLEVWLREDLLPVEDAAILRDYYRTYQRNFGSYVKHHYRNQTRELMAELETRPAARVLEIGCGCGTESLWLAAHAHHVTAVDVSDSLLKVAAARKDILEQALGRRLECAFHKMSVLDMDDDPYDLIWMEQAFHHLEPRAAIVKKIGSLIRPGGSLVISESNAWNPLQQLVLFKLRGMKTIITYNGVPWGHERILTPGRLRREFERIGVEQVSLRYFRTLPNRPWADSLTARIGLFDDVDRWWMRPLYTHYNFVGRKRD
jgi:2-polyprenyl-3-methyl-5-hydroxy-6-metoxy-1,4-benzoquinol methylase